MKKKIIVVVPIVAMIFATAFGILSDNGKAGYTGSSGELKCNDCHNSYGNSNSGTGTIYVTSNIPNWRYVPGQTYIVNVIVKQIGKPLFGLGFEALTSTNANAGSLIITNSTKTTIKTKTVSGVTRNNVVHQLNGGLHADSAIFTFNWTAPTSNIGNITFYFAGIAANNNGNEDLDYAYNGSKVVSPASTTGLSENNKNISNLKAYNNDEGRITLEYSSFEHTSPKINIIDLGGRLVSSEEAGQYVSGEVKMTVSVPVGLKSGMYLIRVISNGESLNSKLFIP